MPFLVFQIKHKLNFALNAKSDNNDSDNESEASEVTVTENTENPEQSENVVSEPTSSGKQVLEVLKKERDILRDIRDIRATLREWSQATQKDATQPESEKHDNKELDQLKEDYVEYFSTDKPVRRSLAEIYNYLNKQQKEALQKLEDVKGKSSNTGDSDSGKSSHSEPTPYDDMPSYMDDLE